MVDTMLSDDEILRRLRLVRHVAWNLRIGRGCTGETISGIARRAGLNRVFLYNLLAGTDILGPDSRRRLSQALDCQENDLAKAIERSHPAEGPILPVFGPSRALSALR